MGKATGKPQKGQPAGSRSASGRKRDRTPIRVEACDGIQRRRAIYRVAANDTDTCDAIGRAYTAGLLGSGERAKSLMIVGRKIASQYWRILGFATPDSLARFQPSQPSTPISDERAKMLEDALNDALEIVSKLSRDHRRYFDQLVIDPNPDFGPPWLDRIVHAQNLGRGPSEADGNAMRLARAGLEALA